MSIPQEIPVKITKPVEIKESNFHKDKKFLIPVIISVVALLVSIVALGIFDKFDLSVKCTGAYISSTNNGDEGIVFILPISFSNVGKKSGIIQDVYINISTKGFTNKYLTAYEIDNTKFYGDEFWTTKRMISTPFLPFDLSSKSSSTKFLLFRPIMGKENNSFFLKDISYNLTVFVKSSEQEDYLEGATFNIHLDQMAINEIQKGSKVYAMGDGTIAVSTFNSTFFYNSIK